MLSMPRTLLNWFGRARCSVRAENNELVTVCNDQALARWSDWTAGLEGWVDYDNGINRVGDVLWLRREWLDSLINEFGGNWIWAATITAHVSGRYGGDTKKVRFHRVYGGSEVIV